MKKVPPTTSSTIKVIPREYATNVALKLRDRITNVTKTLGTTLSIDRNFLSVNFQTPQGFLVEQHQYDFWLLNANNNRVIYRDTIFCTDQQVNQNANEVFDINEGVYVSHDTGDNDYIVID